MTGCRKAQKFYDRLNRKSVRPATIGQQPASANLEIEMQTELHLTHIGGRVDLPDILRIADVAVRIRQVHVVQSIIVFPLELKCLAFRNFKYLTERQIHLIESRAAQ